MQFGYPSFSNLQTTNSRWLYPIFRDLHFYHGLLLTVGNVPGLLVVYLIWQRPRLPATPSTCTCGLLPPIHRNPKQCSFTQKS